MNATPPLFVDTFELYVLNVKKLDSLDNSWVVCDS